MTPPPQATIHTRNSRQFYISGLSLTNVLIRYLDDGSFEKIGRNEGYDLLRKYPLREAISTREAVKSREKKK